MKEPSGPSAGFQPAAPRCSSCRESERAERADDASERREQNGFGEQRREDQASAEAQRLQHGDLADALAHGHARGVGGDEDDAERDQAR